MTMRGRQKPRPEHQRLQGAMARSMELRTIATRVLHARLDCVEKIYWYRVRDDAEKVEKYEKMLASIDATTPLGSLLEILAATGWVRKRLKNAMEDQENGTAPRVESSDDALMEAQKALEENKKGSTVPETVPPINADI